jgi:hypothetical protein
MNHTGADRPAADGTPRRRLRILKLLHDDTQITQGVNGGNRKGKNEYRDEKSGKEKLRSFYKL